MSSTFCAEGNYGGWMGARRGPHLPSPPVAASLKAKARGYCAPSSSVRGACLEAARCSPSRLLSSARLMDVGKFLTERFCRGQGRSLAAQLSQVLPKRAHARTRQPAMSTLKVKW
jgi:hypothetical protein